MSEVVAADYGFHLFRGRRALAGGESVARAGRAGDPPATPRGERRRAPRSPVRRCAEPLHCRRCTTATCRSTTGDRSRYRGRMKSVEFLKRTVCAVLALLSPSLPSRSPPRSSTPSFCASTTRSRRYYDYRAAQAGARAGDRRVGARARGAASARRTPARATMREILDEMLLLSRARQLVIEPSQGGARRGDGRDPQPHGPHDRGGVRQGAAERRHVARGLSRTHVALDPRERASSSARCAPRSRSTTSGCSAPIASARRSSAYPPRRRCRRS